MYKRQRDRCTAREVVEELLDIIHHTDIQDYSDTGINKNLTAVSYLCLLYTSRCV